jgi:chromosome segregation ATPase
VSVASLEELSDVVAAQITQAQRVVLDAARGIANEVGIGAARRSLTDALADIKAAQEQVRAAQDERRAVAEQLDNARRDARLAATFDRVVKECNKTFWIADEDETVMEEFEDGARPVPTGRKMRRQVTADQAAELADAEADRHLVVPRQQLEKCEQELAAARDHLAFCEKRFQAARSDLSAATTQLQVLALALPHTTNEETRR